MNSLRTFLNGFVLILPADCAGCASALRLQPASHSGASHCADHIIRVGFPLVFLEEGGFAFRHNFNGFHLLVDILTAFGLATFSGILTRWYSGESALER
jgi:hypothetical protein